LLVGEPQSADAELGEDLVPERVVAGLLLVPDTIEFDDQRSTVTVKVRDIASAELLAAAAMNPESAAGVPPRQSFLPASDACEVRLHL